MFQLYVQFFQDRTMLMMTIVASTPAELQNRQQLHTAPIRDSDSTFTISHHERRATHCKCNDNDTCIIILRRKCKAVVAKAAASHHQPTSTTVMYSFKIIFHSCKMVVLVGRLIALPTGCQDLTTNVLPSSWLLLEFELFTHRVW